MKFFATLAMLAMGSAAMLAAATPCPAVGNDTNGCEFIITVTAVNSAGLATAFTVAVNAPDQGAYDGVEDTLVGVVNNSGAVLKALTISNASGAFGFDGDGACNGSYTPGPTAAQCLGGAFQGSANGADYLSLTATSFSNITTATGTINFNNIAAAGTSWFDLEGALTAAQISGTATVPAPSSIVLLLIGLVAVAMFLFAKNKFARVS
jgi:hypothetical protein